nr:SWI/SNF-related matrix-associated actin-dependent regulator of chromatin subfamily A-like protein 1 isoform X4 [Arachis hypogaea]
MSLLKNCRSFLSNFFFIPAGMLQRNSNMTRLWMFPLSSLSEAEKVLGEISNYKVQLEVVKAKIKSAKSKDESESVKFTQKNLINKIYTNSADAKIPAALEYLGTVIEAGCKFLIFALHQPMIDAIHECLLKKKVGCIWIDGGTPAASRQQLVTDFQEKDYIKAAVVWCYPLKREELD